MNKQEILDEITKLKERLNELEKMYDRLNLPNKRWRAEKDKNYYFISAGGEVRQGAEYELTINDCHYTFGNYFKTREEAEFEVERLRVIAELREWATPVDEFNWNSYHEYKYTLEIGSEPADGKFSLNIEHWTIYQTSDLVFASEEIARKAIEAVGEERIIKYYFRRKLVTNKVKREIKTM